MLGPCPHLRALARSLEVLPQCFAGDLQGAMLKLHTEEPKKQPEKKETPAKGPEKPGLLKSLFGRK